MTWPSSGEHTMTAWAHSLIRISNYKVETLQKRLSEITERRATAEIKLAVLDAEAEAERDRARHGRIIEIRLGRMRQHIGDRRHNAVAHARDQRRAAQLCGDRI